MRGVFVYSEVAALNGRKETDMQDDLIASIHDAVNELDPNLAKGSEDFDAACLCLLLYKCEFDSWDDIQTGAPLSLGVSAERIGQFIVNLRLGDALLEDGFHTAIREELDGDGGGMTVLLLVNIAQGRMRYLPEHGTFSMTPMGVRYVKEKILRAQ